MRLNFRYDIGNRYIDVAKQLRFLKRIEQAYEQLSPRARMIASYLQHHPLDVVTDSIAEIAEKTSTSKATISRFFRQLGYESHQDVKQELRSSGYPLNTVAENNDYLKQELSRVSQTLANLNQNELDALIDAVCEASRVTLIGFRNSYPVALHFRQQLLQIRDKVRLLPQPGQTLSEELLDISDNELVILIGFRRRPKIFGALVEKLKGHKLALLTDPSGQIYTSQVSHLLVCQLGKELALDSYAAPMSVISVICNSAYAKMASKAKLRISAISDFYDDLQELENH